MSMVSTPMTGLVISRRRGARREQLGRVAARWRGDHGIHVAEQLAAGPRRSSGR